PGEVRVRLREAELGEAIHDLRPRERLGQEQHVGVLALNLADQPFPEWKGLRVRVVDAKYADSVLDPEIDDALQLRPQGAKVIGLEIEGVDILVFLRRVLRVLHTAVGAVLEPFGMRAHVGMIGCALEGDVESNLHAELARRGHQVPEILERTELPQNFLVAARGGADGPGTADVAGLRFERVVRPLAVDAPDRLDGREVDDVEAHPGNVRQARFDVLGVSLPRRLRGGGAGKELVPAAEARALAIREYLQCGRIGETAVRMALHQASALGIERKRLE